MQKIFILASILLVSNVHSFNTDVQKTSISNPVAMKSSQYSTSLIIASEEGSLYQYNSAQNLFYLMNTAKNVHRTSTIFMSSNKLDRNDLITVDSSGLIRFYIGYLILWEQIDLNQTIYSTALTIIGEREGLIAINLGKTVNQYHTYTRELVKIFTHSVDIISMTYTPNHMHLCVSDVQGYLVCYLYSSKEKVMELKVPEGSLTQLKCMNQQTDNFRIIGLSAKNSLIEIFFNSKEIRQKTLPKQKINHLSICPTNDRLFSTVEGDVYYISPTEEFDQHTLVYSMRQQVIAIDCSQTLIFLDKNGNVGITLNMKLDIKIIYIIAFVSIFLITLIIGGVCTYRRNKKNQLLATAALLKYKPYAYEENSQQIKIEPDHHQHSIVNQRYNEGFDHIYFNLQEQEQAQQGMNEH